MAIYHLSIKTVSRSSGRSAVAAAAYRSGTRLADERTGEVADYRRKRGVERSEIVTPATAPAWARDREALWNAAERAERRKNSVTAREYEVALPAELSPRQRQEAAREFACWLAERFGVAADIAIHAPGEEGDQRNHHAHILTTTRALGMAGLGAKTRALDDRRSGAVEEVRATWAETINRALERARMAERVDHRSHARRGIEEAPTVHLGPAASAMERRGMETERGGINRLILAANQALCTARQAFFDIREKITKGIQRALSAYIERLEELKRTNGAIFEIEIAGIELDLARKYYNTGDYAPAGLYGTRISKEAGEIWRERERNREAAKRSTVPDKTAEPSRNRQTSRKRNRSRDFGMDM